MQITDPQRLDELRDEIDAIDRELVSVIARRSAVVREVMTLKRDTEAARSPQRVEKVVANAKELAKECGAPPEVVEAAYRAMITALTEMQIKHIGDDVATG